MLSMLRTAWMRVFRSALPASRLALVLTMRILFPKLRF